MVVTPSKSMAPATIRVRVGVAPDADNRVLNVIADSGAYYRSSEIQLDGDRARRASWWSSSRASPAAVTPCRACCGMRTDAAPHR